MLFILALLIGVVAGLRTMTAPAAVAWGAWLGWLPLAGTWAGFMGHWIAVGIFTILAIAELVADQLPSTPSRKVPQQFGARIVSGAFTGAVIGTTGGAIISGLIAGAIGAVIGTLGGAELRKRLAIAFGKDQPAAFIEDAVAIVGGLLIVAAVA
ncbi:putative membrane protein [Mesorhizobium robiniae]|uniref:Membrane protein n=1 Tax=Mesorhizobium robiniae TaxID=559315 RepID=A0ABV2GTC7_9HYPH